MFNLSRNIVKVSLAAALAFGGLSAHAQSDAKASARMDATHITIGDQARVFIEVQNNPSTGTLQWAAIPDTFNTLEVVEKGKIDTIHQGGFVTYKQRLLITGFDSGAFKIPSFVFSVIPKSGNAYTVQTDSFTLGVSTVAVDTTKAFKGIKNIIYVKSTWLDFLILHLRAIMLGWLLLGVIIGLTIYLVKRSKRKPVAVGPILSLQDRTLKQLSDLEMKQLWQKNQPKEYYIQLTDIVRGYIEHRFSTPAMELTTDELLYKAQLHKELQPYYQLLADVLNTADLAKFAKYQPMPQQHMDAMSNARRFVDSSRPVAAPQAEPSPEPINPQQ
jgi:hypothetical protein